MPQLRQSRAACVQPRHFAGERVTVMAARHGTRRRSTGCSIDARGIYLLLSCHHDGAPIWLPAPPSVKTARLALGAIHNDTRPGTGRSEPLTPYRRVTSTCFAGAPCQAKQLGNKHHTRLVRHPKPPDSRHITYRGIAAPRDGTIFQSQDGGYQYRSHGSSASRLLEQASRSLILGHVGVLIPSRTWGALGPADVRKGVPGVVEDGDEP